jgi:hypothetical protein
VRRPKQGNLASCPPSKKNAPVPAASERAQKWLAASQFQEGAPFYPEWQGQKLKTKKLK